MLRWAFTFLIVALIAGAFGLTGVEGAAAGIAKGLFVAFLVLFGVTAIAGIAAGRKLSGAIRHDKDRDRHLTHH